MCHNKKGLRSYRINDYKDGWYKIKEKKLKFGGYGKHLAIKLKLSENSINIR